MGVAMAPACRAETGRFPFSGLGRCLLGVTEFYLMVVFSVLNLAGPCLEILVNEPLKRSGNAPFQFKAASETTSRVHA